MKGSDTILKVKLFDLKTLLRVKMYHEVVGDERK